MLRGKYRHCLKMDFGDGTETAPTGWQGVRTRADLDKVWTKLCDQFCRKTWAWESYILYGWVRLSTVEIQSQCSVNLTRLLWCSGDGEVPTWWQRKMKRLWWYHIPKDELDDKCATVRKSKYFPLSSIVVMSWTTEKVGSWAECTVERCF